MRSPLIRLTRGALVAMLLATVAVRAQVTSSANLYEDPELTRMLVDTTSGMALISAVDPTVVLLAAPAIAVNVTYHELLTIARVDAEMSMMSAIMTEAFRDQDTQIRTAVAATHVLLNKLQSDIAYYDAKYPAFKSGAAPSAAALLKEFEIYTELKRRLALFQKGGLADIVTPGDQLIAAFDKMRATVLGKGLFSRVQFIQNATGLTPLLKKFGEASRHADEEMAKKLKLTGGAEVDASPMQQLRMMVENTSSDDKTSPAALVFFVRVWERTEFGGTATDCGGGSYKLPDILAVDGTSTGIPNAAWTVVWPQNASPQFGGVSAGTAKEKPDEVRLPSKVFVPFHLRDRLEVRVATYGQLRKRIRWEDVVGRVTRPELSSMPRGFYWLAYEAIQTDAPGGYGTLKSRWFPTEETYAWNLSGSWSESVAGPLKARLESTSGDARKELRVSALDQGATSLLKLSNDRAVFCMPRAVADILSDPIMSAEITGDTKVNHVTAKDPTGQSQSEHGSGQIVITMVRW